MEQGTPRYYYRIHGNHYDVCEKATGQRLPGEPYYYNREEARKRVYELNGWRYKPCKKN